METDKPAALPPAERPAPTLERFLEALDALQSYETQEIESMQGIGPHDDWLKRSDVLALASASPVSAPLGVPWIDGETFGQHAERCGDGPCLGCVGKSVSGPIADTSDSRSKEEACRKDAYDPAVEQVGSRLPSTVNAPVSAHGSAWQTMESAPKDGSRIDVWAKAWLPAFDRFEYRRFADAYWWKGDSMGNSGPQWMNVDKDWSAQFWMPLPSPPGASK